MPRATSGSLRLFRLAGIDVYLHASWLLVAVFLFWTRLANKPLPPWKHHAPLWAIAEYFALFGIVLLHEFGHALACRQVGGRASSIVLWPLGGLAYVNPPPRPGATLWSVAAGPLVNLILVPVTIGLCLLSAVLDWSTVRPDAARFLLEIAFLNGGLLFLNLLPVYPLDGGQILYALLWFIMGRANSLLVVSLIGLGMAVLGFALTILLQMPLLAVVMLFAAFWSWIGLQRGRLMGGWLNRPRHADAACPHCGEAPPLGKLWLCDQCDEHFDLFAHRAVCPNCFQRFPSATCFHCGSCQPTTDWFSTSKSQTANNK